MEIAFTEEKFVICHNGADVVHYSKVLPGTIMTSGQPYYEEFSSEQEWKNRLAELGVVLEEPDPEPQGASGKNPRTLKRPR